MFSLQLNILDGMSIFSGVRQLYHHLQINSFCRNEFYLYVLDISLLNVRIAASINIYINYPMP